MVLTLQQQRIIKWIKTGCAIAVFVIAIILAVVANKQKATIKTQDYKIKALTEQVDSLQRVNSMLGAEDVITVNVTFELNQKNVLSFAQTNAQNIAKEISKMTRQELMDSIYVKKNTK